MQLTNQQMLELQTFLRRELFLPELELTETSRKDQWGDLKFYYESGEINQVTDSWFSRFVTSFFVSVACDELKEEQPFTIGAFLTVTFNYGRWESGGSNGFRGDLFYCPKEVPLLRWMSREEAIAMVRNGC